MESATTTPPLMPKSVLIVAPSPPPYGGMALQARLLEDMLRKDGVQVDFLAANLLSSNWMAPLNRIPGVRTLLRAVLIWPRLLRLAKQAEVIHIFAASWLYFFLVVWPAVLIGKFYRKRVILNYRGGEAADFFRQYGQLAGPALRVANVVTAPSDFLAETIGNHFGIPVVIVPNILDLAAFQFRERTHFSPKLLVTRHLERIYDVESVLRAFQLIQADHPGSSLWIAGTGSQESHLRKLVADWELRNVRFLGFVARGDLPGICDQCDILINASLVDNFPGALVEASAAGLVVVSTGAGGIPFMYQDGKDALLVKPGDWQGLARAVQKVLSHPEIATSLTQEALTMAKNCGWPEVRKRLYAVYGFQFEEHTGAGELKCVAG